MQTDNRYETYQTGFKFKDLGTTPCVDLGGGGAEAKNQHFQNMVMLHIKLKGTGMHEHSSKYFAHRPLPGPLRQGQKVKIQLFQNMIMLHILKGMTNAATYKCIFCLYTQPRPLGWVKGQNIFF